MKQLNGWALVSVTPLAALLAAGGMWFASSQLDSGRAQAKTPDLSKLSVGIKKYRFQFTEADIDPIVTAMSNSGIDDFVCWIDPDTGAISVVTAIDSKPHLDIKPGHCPNNVNVNAGDDDDDDDGDDDGGHDDVARVSHHAAALVPVVNVGLLGNAFDITQVDIGTVRLSMAIPFLTDPGELAPLDATFLDVGTPFEGTSCLCTSAGPDGELDLDMHFDEQAMIDTFGLQTIPNHTLVPLRATGMTSGGRAIFGTRDCIRIINH